MGTCNYIAATAAIFYPQLHNVSPCNGVMLGYRKLWKCADFYRRHNKIVESWENIGITVK